MLKSRRIVLSTMIATTVALCAVACSEKRSGGDDAGLVESLKSDGKTLRAASTGHGFVCREINGRIGCVCDENAGPDSILSCAGMERVCNRLGTGRICNPADDWCTCFERL